MNEEHRRLAVIAFTDIAGFTEKMAEDEDVAFELVAHQRRLFRPIVENYRGTWLKEMGDGLLLTFESARTCVDCCIELQHASQPVPDLNVRISIHLGEIIQVSNDVYGDDVNVASRIEKYSPVGGIAISENVQASLARSTAYETTLIGAPILKGVGRDIRIYAITSHNLPGPPAVATETSSEKTPSMDHAITPAKPSLLVIPFVNISRRPEDEVICDGLTDALISQLSRIENIRPVSRTSAMLYKNVDKSVREIGAELDLEFLVEGSVLIVGEHIQISTSLIHVAEDEQIWSEIYEHSFENILQIFKDVSKSVVRRIEESINIDPDSRQIREIAAYIVNPDAYKLYLKGRQFRLRKDVQSTRTAEYHLTQSVAIDPTFAAAHAELALNSIMRGAFGYVTLDDRLREKTQKSADMALALDQRACEAYIALALTWEIIDHDSDQAARFAEQAVKLDPSNAEAIQEEAFILGRIGRFDAAFAKMNETLVLDPLSISARNGRAYLYLYQDRFSDAIAEMKALLELEPSHYLARIVSSLAWTGLHDYERALGELDEIPMANSNIHIVAQRGYVSGRIGDTADTKVQMTLLCEQYRDNPLFFHACALIALGCNKIDECIKALTESNRQFGYIYRDKTIGRDFRMDEMRARIQQEDLTYV